jgi:hypothetical protein
MKNQEELRARWDAIHKKPEVAPAPTAESIPGGYTSIGYRFRMTSSKPTRITNESLKHLSNAVFEASSRNLSSIVPPGKKNNNWYLLNLEGKVDWYGNIAVGRDKHLQGWWDVVPPAGCCISFCGEGAEERAREQAQKLQGEYE